MAMQSDFRGYRAEANVGDYRIVKHGATNQSCVQATGPTDALIGVNDSLAHVTGEVCDISYSPLSEVILGGTVTRGQPLTSDAAAAAVVATVASSRLIGFADQSGVAGDVILFQRAPGLL